LDSVAFDGNTTLTFQVHVIEHLILELAIIHGFRILEKAVGQCTFTMVDMRYNAEISDVFHKGAKIQKKMVRPILQSFRAIIYFFASGTYIFLWKAEKIFFIFAA